MHKLEPAQLANFFQCGLVTHWETQKNRALWLMSSAMDMVPGDMCLFWTGHSGWHSVPQVATAIGCPKAQHFLGCWSIGSWLCSFSNPCGGLPERAIQPS